MDDLAKKNRRIGFIVLAVVLCMVGLTALSIPLYRLYCQVTGYGGQAVRAENAAPDVVLDRSITVRFNTVVDKNLPWEFAADQGPVTVRIGQEALISFSATNTSQEAMAGSALFNVSPPLAGVYFHKTQCFCFDYQMIAPGETVHFPVVFYIDPELADDAQLDDLKSVTLSYSFYRAESEELDRALEAFYNQEK
ncbi:MAG TPA: cytochrome c oxidase assembly protein [Alphaproteobacteria bacterium]|nr:cytochrome c oxidase assembly protein [Alphaproteobacteria bacterium]HOO51502.1 cytochrome c oxidase assembly protein [Alphaproteobacteria bacterium]